VDDRLNKSAVKNGCRITVKLKPMVLEVLARLPHPKAAPGESRLYFVSFR
jgi:hypothetical protein